MSSLYYSCHLVFTKPLQARRPLRFLLLIETYTTLALYFDKVDSKSIVIFKHRSIFCIPSQRDFPAKTAFLGKTKNTSGLIALQIVENSKN